MSKEKKVKEKKVKECPHGYADKCFDECKYMGKDKKCTRDKNKLTDPA